MEPSEPEPFDGLIASFDRSLRAARRSPKTIKGYTDAASRFATYGAAHDHPADLAGIERRHVEAFITDQLDRWSPSTAATRFRYLQQFFKFAVEEGEIVESPMRHMSPPTLDEKPVPVIADAEIAALLAACDGTSFDQRRDTAIVRFLLDTGVRVGELIGLAVDDVRLGEHVAVVTGKGNRTRPVAFGDKTTVALDRYLRLRRRHPHATSDSLWVGLRGPMTDSGIAQMLRRRGADAGVEDLHPHRFRHTLAHRWMAHGGSEGDLQAFAGWRSPQMLARYGASARAERALATHQRLGLGDRY